MATSDNADPIIYPAFCFKASPTHFTWVKMSVADVHRLQKPRNFEGQKIFFYKNHPIRFVTIAGLIVARTDIYRRTLITIDDSSGAIIEVVVHHSSNPEHQVSAEQGETQKDKISPDNEEESTSAKDKEGSASRALASAQPVHISTTDESIIDISSLVPGTLVKIKGTLNSFRSMIQLNLERFVVLRDTNAEMVFLEERVRFLVEVLSPPWVLSDGEIEMLRREVEEGDVKAAEEKERARRRVKRRAEREEKDAESIMRRYRQEEREREKEAGVCREEGARVMKEILERKRVKLGQD